MEPLPIEILAPLAAIAAALIAASIALVTAVLAKETKVSEFRQAWIDALRNDVADFIEAMHRRSYEGLLVSTKAPEIDTHTRALIDSAVRMSMLHARIMLRINPKEHTQLDKALTDAHSFMGANDYARTGTTEEAWQIVACLRRIETEGAATLKSEWKRVKRGELWYRFTKWSALVLVIGLLALLVVASWKLPAHIGPERLGSGYGQTR